MIWQPIETAPKNGTRVLLIDMSEGASCEVCWGEWEDWDDGGPGEWRDVGDIGCNGQYDYKPTHWQPLPDPPSDWKPEGFILPDDGGEAGGKAGGR